MLGSHIYYKNSVSAWQISSYNIKYLIFNIVIYTDGDVVLG